MRRAVPALLVLLLAPAVAGAEDEASDPVDPVPTRVAARLVDGAAQLTVSVELAVHGPIHSSQHVVLETPATAVVTAATVARDGATRRLDLMPVARAATAFDALSGDATAAALPSAVLIEGGRGEVNLSIASPRPGRIRLTLELTAPTCYLRDARHLLVPDSWAKLAPATVRAPIHTRAAIAAACNADGATGSWLSFPQHDLRRRRAGDRLGVVAARLDMGTQHLVRVEVGLAGSLGEVPKDLSTVIVVDGSRSLSADEREAQRAVVAAYLDQVGDRPVQLVAFARHAQPLLPSWLPARHARARIDRELRALAPRNGSNFDLGLELAGAWLARVGGTPRVLLITDQRMATRLSTTPAATLQRAVPAGTLIHVVTPNQGGGALERDDDAALGELAKRTHGMSVGTTGAGALDATQLARPISLDNVEIRASGWTATDDHDATSCTGGPVDEGTSCMWWGTGHVSSGPIAVVGDVWGRRVVRVVQPDPRQGQRLARALTGAGTGPSFDQKTHERIDELARAVNDHWSLFATWGGPGRYEGGFGRIFGTSCCGSATSNTHVGHSITMHRTTQPTDLRPQLAAATVGCGLGDATARVEIELTFREIVDVAVELDGASSSDARDVTACITEAAWEMSPMIADPRFNATHVVTLGR